jgi:hypothetical protein
VEFAANLIVIEKSEKNKINLDIIENIAIFVKK